MTLIGEHCIEQSNDAMSEITQFLRGPVLLALKAVFRLRTIVSGQCNVMYSDDRNKRRRGTNSTAT